MKSKKNGKEGILKNKYVGFLVVVLLLVFAILGVTKILGREINVVCEDKKGNLFVPRDNNGKIDGCGKHGDAITFNFGDETNNGGIGNVGEKIDIGNLVFLESNYALTKEGKTYFLTTDNSSNPSWLLREDLALPNGVTVDNIVQWSGYVFATKDTTWFFIGGVWRDVGFPTN